MEIQVDTKSESAVGYFTILTDKNVYYPGEVMYGQVILRLNQNLKECGALYVQFEGKETFKFLTKCKKYNSVENRKELINEKLLLCQFNQSVIAKRDYHFVFNYKVPNEEQSDLPASFNYKKDLDFCRAKFRIRYKMKVYITKQNNDNEFVLKNKKRIFIAKQVFTPRNNFIEQSISKVSKFRDILNAGITKISCNFERNFYVVGEQAKSLCQIDNSQCSTDIKKVTISLVRKIFFSGYPLVFNNQTGNNIQTFMYNEIVAQTEVDGVPARYKPLSDEQFDLSLNLFLDDYKSEFNDKRLKKNKPWSHQDLAFASMLQPTSHAFNFSCVYSLEINGQVSGIYNQPGGISGVITINPCSEQVNSFIYPITLYNWNPYVIDLRYENQKQRYVAGYNKRQIQIQQMFKLNEFREMHGDNIKLKEDEEIHEVDGIHHARRPYLLGFENE